ncbi:MAG: S4 domain-containing protein [Erythrobacter sp.]
MTAVPGAPTGLTMRLDRLLVYLRFAKTRSAACALIEGHGVRRNRQPVRRANEPARIGDVLTLALASGVRVVEITALPVRRGSPAEARAHYREISITNLDTGNLDPIGEKALAAPSSGRG